MFLGKEEVNIGRQVEFDYLKGLFVPMIILIHAFQLMGGTAEPFYEVFYPVCTLTGSTIFLFVMGLGSTYSKRTEKQMVISGLKLIVWQILWNIFALAVPFLLGYAIRDLLGLSTDMWSLVVGQSVVLLQYINIFYIAGVSYLFLALLKKLHIPTWGYFLIATVLLIITPYFYITDFTTGFPCVDYILTAFCGGRDSVSLILGPHLVYTLFGVWFGRIIRRTTDKNTLYKCIIPIASMIGISYVAYAVFSCKTLTEFCNFMSYQYIFPTSMKMIVNLCWILAMVAVLYWISPWIKKSIWLHNKLLHFNYKTSAYYAIHPFLFCVITSVVAMEPLGCVSCITLTVVNIIFSWHVVSIWENKFPTQIG